MVWSCCAATGSSISASLSITHLEADLVVRLCIWLQDAIRRVQDLEKMGHLSGVMDDRGKVSRHLFWLQLHVVIVHNPMSQ